MLITIYRIEKECGQGCYYGTDNSSWMQEGRSHTDRLIHPEPDQDGIPTGDLCGDWRCAFDSMKALHNWFTDIEISNLRKMDFDIVSYEVQHYAVSRGAKQLVYLHKDAVKIKAA